MLLGFALASIAIFGPVTAANAVDILPIPDDNYYISDSLNYISRPDASKLAVQIADIKEKYDVQTGVVIIDSTHEQSIENYAFDTAIAWGLEEASTTNPNVYEGNGVLVVVAADDRRIEVYAAAGLSERLSSEQATMIQSEIIAPLLTEGNYPSAISEGLTVEAQIFNEYNANSAGTKNEYEQTVSVVNSIANVIKVLVLSFVALVAVFGVIIMVRRLSKKAKQTAKTLKHTIADPSTSMGKEAGSLFYKGLPNAVKNKLQGADLSRQTAILREQVYLNHKNGKLNHSSVKDSDLVQMILNELNGTSTKAQTVTTTKLTSTKLTSTKTPQKTSSNNSSDGSVYPYGMLAVGDYGSDSVSGSTDSGGGDGGGGGGD